MSSFVHNIIMKHDNTFNFHLFDLQKGQTSVIPKVNYILMQIYLMDNTMRNTKISSKHDNMHNNEVNHAIKNIKKY